MKEQVDALLARERTFDGEEAAKGAVVAGKPEEESGVLAEVAKLQRMVGDLKEKVGQQHQAVREWIGTKDESFAEGIDAGGGVLGKLDLVLDMLMTSRGDRVDTPRYACVLPPWKFAEANGLSEEEQKEEVWLARLKEWQEGDFKEGKGWFIKKKRLFLVCAHTRRLVPCGPNGHGYDVQQPREWFRMSVNVAIFALQVMCATLVAMAAAPVSGAGGAVDATISAAAENFDSILQDRLAELTLDDDSMVQDGLEEVTNDDDRADVNIGPQVRQINYQCESTDVFVATASMPRPSWPIRSYISST